MELDTWMIAALYVEKNGPYAELAGIDVWDRERDARKYRGPHKVIAHPPCERWGRYWSGGPSGKVRQLLGDDGGCCANVFHESILEYRVGVPGRRLSTLDLCADCRKSMSVTFDNWLTSIPTDPTKTEQPKKRWWHL